MQRDHINYILRDRTSRCTYNGFTTDVKRRVRQHNGEIKGGARSTSARPGAWEVIAVVTAREADGTPISKKRALSVEWSVRYPTNKRPRPREFTGPEGRIRSLALVFSNPKFAGVQWTVRVHAAYRSIAESTLSCTVAPL